MQVNPQKTQLLTISTSHNHVYSYIKDGGITIQSTTSLKLPGVHLNDRLSFNNNTKMIQRNFAMRAWTLTHLCEAGLSKGTLVQIYKTYIQLILEYACKSFCSLLTKEQSELIERCQRIALQTIFGQQLLYRQCLERGQIERLDFRRAELTRKFAIKAYVNDRFTHYWFP